jgi:hypothetical protein
MTPGRVLSCALAVVLAAALAGLIAGIALLAAGLGLVIVFGAS